MSNENWTATDCGKYIRVRAPNGGTCEMWGDADDAHERFAYFVLRQMISDLAAVTEVSAKLASERACEMVRADNAEKELDHARGIVRACERDYKAQLADAKAKLAACERQEPVAVCVAVNEWTTEPRYMYPADDKNPPAGTKLYANPMKNAS